MDSDYEYEYDDDDDDDFPESDEEMASGDDYEFDAQAYLHTAAKKVCCRVIMPSRQCDSRALADALLS